MAKPPPRRLNVAERLQQQQNTGQKYTRTEVTVLGGLVTVKKQPLSALFLFLRLTVAGLQEKSTKKKAVSDKLFLPHWWSSDPRHTAKNVHLDLFEDSNGERFRLPSNPNAPPEGSEC